MTAGDFHPKLVPQTWLTERVLSLLPINNVLEVWNHESSRKKVQDSQDISQSREGHKTRASKILSTQKFKSKALVLVAFMNPTGFRRMSCKIAWCNLQLSLAENILRERKVQATNAEIFWLQVTELTWHVTGIKLDFIGSFSVTNAANSAKMEFLSWMVTKTDTWIRTLLETVDRTAHCLSPWSMWSLAD